MLVVLGCRETPNGHTDAQMSVWTAMPGLGCQPFWWITNGSAKHLHSVGLSTCLEHLTLVVSTSMILQPNVGSHCQGAWRGRRGFAFTLHVLYNRRCMLRAPLLPQKTTSILCFREGTHQLSKMCSTLMRQHELIQLKQLQWLQSSGRSRRSSILGHPALTCSRPACY